MEKMAMIIALTIICVGVTFSAIATIGAVQRQIENGATEW